MTRGAQLAALGLAGVAFVVWKKQSTIGALAAAIGYVESRGNYQAIGPATRDGNRAYGKYQVLDVNIGPWSNAILGRPLTVAEWLADPVAQDAVARAKLAEYWARYGGAADVASVWFSGRPLAQAAASADVTGTTVPAYVQRVLDAMGTA
jgi:hypothetical protein